MTHEPLPLRSAMHRDDPKGSRLEIANAYAVGRLIDGQAITDAYRAFNLDETNTTWVALTSALDALTEEEGSPLV